MSESAGIRRIIDVSHEIEAGMITYPGLPAPVVSDYLSREASRGKYAEGTTFQIGRIEMIANTGTYIDAPFHRFEDGHDLSRLPLEQLADVEGLVIDATGRNGRAIDEGYFQGLDLRDKAVLIRAGWDAHWRTPQYGEGAPFVTRRAAELLVEIAPALVGVDSVNIDDAQDGARPAHTLLLGAGIPVVEHLCNLNELPARGFRFHCVPVKFRGVGTFPVRAYAVIG
ncbi:MAG TPA: cyclase family protein [Blastocatellia bacterium]|nr:cyclase family protein [Blastocatellia bacterium]